MAENSITSPQSPMVNVTPPDLSKVQTVNTVASPTETTTVAGDSSGVPTSVAQSDSQFAATKVQIAQNKADWLAAHTDTTPKKTANSTTADTAPTSAPTQTAVDKAVDSSIASTENVVANIPKQTEAVTSAIKDSVATEKANADNQVNAETQYAQTQTANAQARIAELNAQQAEYAAAQQASLDRYKSVEDTSFQKQKEYDAAAIANAQTQADIAAKQMEIDNDVARMQTNMSLGKLGLNFSTGGANMVIRTIQQGTYNLAKLRSENAFKISGLQLDANKLETEHALRINEAIDTATNNILDNRQKASKEIYQVQNDIALTAVEKERRIAKITKDYSEFRVKANKDLFDVTIKANEELARQTKLLEEQVDKRKKDAKEEAMGMVVSGRWQSMTPAQKAYYEQRAGLQPGWIEAEVNAQITAKMNKALEFFTKSFGVDVSDVPSEVLAEAQRTTMARMKMGFDIDTSVMYWLNVIKGSDKFKELSELATAGSKYAKAQADIAAKEASIKLTEAKTATELMKPSEIQAKIAKLKRSWSGGGSGGSSVKLTNIKTIDGVLQGLGKDGKYHVIYLDNGKPATQDTKAEKSVYVDDEGNAHRIEWDASGVGKVTWTVEGVGKTANSNDMIYE